MKVMYRNFRKINLNKEGLANVTRLKLTFNLQESKSEKAFSTTPCFHVRRRPAACKNRLFDLNFLQKVVLSSHDRPLARKEEKNSTW
jgi:hypothetical protein